MEVPVAKLWKPLELDAGSIAEAFRIDDLLDFSNEEIAGPIGDDNLQLSCLSSDSSVTAIEIEKGSSNSVLPKGRGLEQAIARDFCVPCEDVTADLEWLSNFVEDSFSTDDGHKPINLSSLQIDFLDKQTELSTNREQNFQVLSPVSVLESSATSGAIANFPSVPGKARSKRPRGGARVWSSSGLLGAQACQAPGYGGSGSTDSGSSGSITYDYPQGLSTDSEILMAEERGMVEFFNPKKYQKQSRGRKGSDGSNQPRRCTHCLTQRTPQWRAGPMGPKTLCNACGVRFKSGRLVPEYRPAGSPTFVSEKHSNSHRKILEMRRLKETDSSFLRHESVDLIQAQQQIFHSDSVLIDTHDQILHPNSVLIHTHPQSLVPILTQHRIHHSDPVLTDSDHFFEQIEQEELHSPHIAVSEEHASESKESASEKENVIAEENSVGFEKSVHENVVEGTELEIVACRSETSL